MFVTVDKHQHLSSFISKTTGLNTHPTRWKVVC